MFSLHFVKRDVTILQRYINIMSSSMAVSKERNGMVVGTFKFIISRKNVGKESDWKEINQLLAAVIQLFCLIQIKFSYMVELVLTSTTKLRSSRLKKPNVKFTLISFLTFSKLSQLSTKWLRQLEEKISTGILSQRISIKTKCMLSFLEIVWPTVHLESQ